jgi:hypothetical protein
MPRTGIPTRPRLPLLDMGRVPAIRVPPFGPRELLIFDECLGTACRFTVISAPGLPETRRCRAHRSQTRIRTTHYGIATRTRTLITHAGGVTNLGTSDGKLRQHRSSSSRRPQQGVGVHATQQAYELLSHTAPPVRSNTGIRSGPPQKALADLVSIDHRYIAQRPADADSGGQLPMPDPKAPRPV